MEPNTQRDTDPFINTSNSYESTYSDGQVGSEYDNSVTRDSWRVMAENLYHDMVGLWDKQSMLVKTEINEKVGDIKTASVSLIGGGVVMVAGVFSLVATAIILFNLIMPLWASAVLVTAILFIVGGVMLMTAKKKFEADRLKPRHSIETLGDISNTFKERIYEFKRH